MDGETVLVGTYVHKSLTSAHLCLRTRDSKHMAATNISTDGGVRYVNFTSERGIQGLIDSFNTPLRLDELNYKDGSKAPERDVLYIKTKTRLACMISEHNSRFERRG